MARRRRRIMGLVPSCGRALSRCGRWALRHPQPFLLACAMPILGWMLWGSLQRAEPFRITRVELPSDPVLRLRTPLIGQSLMTVDLRALADDLTAQQPWLKEVRVVRRFPTTLRIDPIPRIPIAQVRGDRWYPVDREGVVLPGARPAPDEGLTRLVGLERPGAALRVGQAVPDERLQLALRVLASVTRVPALASRRLTEVNVSDPQQIRFLIDGVTEVRCGSELELQTHLQRLHTALRAIARAPFEVGSIDVRFPEPVISPRT